MLSTLSGGSPSGWRKKKISILCIRETDREARDGKKTVSPCGDSCPHCSDHQPLDLWLLKKKSSHSCRHRERIRRGRHGRPYVGNQTYERDDEADRCSERKPARRFFLRPFRD